MATTPPHDQLAPTEAATTSDARRHRRAGDPSLKNWLATTRQHVDRRILTQVRILTVIALAMLGIVVVDVAQGTLGVAWAAAGLLAGAALGVIASRIRRLEWDDQTSQVIARLDAIGAVILVGYIAAMLARDWVLGHWVEGPALAALGLSVTAGALAGQVLGTRRGVRKVLEALGLRAPADLAAVQAPPSAPDRPTPEGAGSTGDGEWQAPEDAAAVQASRRARRMPSPWPRATLRRVGAGRWMIGPSRAKGGTEHEAVRRAGDVDDQRTADAGSGGGQVAAGPEHATIIRMSKRELEVLSLMAQGLTNSEIAQQIVISAQTVKVHTRNIYGKLGVNSQWQAVTKARTLGLLA